jgi:hypothetical protein
LGEPFVRAGVGGELGGTGLRDVGVPFADHDGCVVGVGGADKAVTTALKVRVWRRQMEWRDVL